MFEQFATTCGFSVFVDAVLKGFSHSEKDFLQARSQLIYPDAVDTFLFWNLSLQLNNNEDGDLSTIVLEPLVHSDRFQFIQAVKVCAGKIWRAHESTEQIPEGYDTLISPHADGTSTSTWKFRSRYQVMPMYTLRFKTTGIKHAVASPLLHLDVDNLPPLENAANVTVCPLCTRAFTFFHRKHHCRNCGRVVCDPCSNQKRKLQKLGTDSKPVRVCNSCLNSSVEDVMLS